MAYIETVSSPKIKIKKLDNTEWVSLADPVFIGYPERLSLAMSFDDVPYIAFEDYYNSNKLSVMKYNGTSWVFVGTEGFTAGGAKDIDITIDKNGIPYVVYADYLNSFKCTVKRYNGNVWEIVGVPMSLGSANYCSIEFDSFNSPFVVYSDYHSLAYKAI